MKYSSDYDHDDRHWKFARTLPRRPAANDDRAVIRFGMLTVLAIIIASITSWWLAQ